MPNPKKPRKNCLVCGKEPARSIYKYCSNLCQQEYEYRRYLEEWKSGKVVGLTSIGLVSAYVKRYLREKFDNKCCLCGWNEINKKIGYSPLVADHMDGQHRK